MGKQGLGGLLPSPGGGFVNHDDLLRDARRWILDRASRNRTVVIGGGPGNGKTAMCAELVRRLDGYFDDLLWFEFPRDVELIDGASELLKQALIQLRVPRDDIPDEVGARRTMYRRLTAGQSLVIFLDGVVTEQQSRALEPGPGSSLVLVTEARSVTPTDGSDLRLIVVDVLPEPAAHRLLEDIVGTDAVAAEPVDAAEIVKLCGRIPHALTIVGSAVRRAAARGTATPMAETVERLRDPDRRRSVLPTDRVFGFAYRGLSDSARRCYRALGLSAHGGVVGAEMMAVVLDCAVGEAAESLIELADSRLIEPRAGARYKVRDLVRRHMREMDDRSEEELMAQDEQALRYYDQRILAADLVIAPTRPWRRILFPEFTSSTVEFTDAAEARAWLRTERLGIRAAVQYAFDAELDDLVLRWCVWLWAFYEKEKMLDDLDRLHELGLLAAQRSGAQAVQSLLHTQLGFAHYWRHDLEAAAAQFEAGIECATRLDVEASAVEGLGLVRLDQELSQEAGELLRRNEKLADQIEDPRRCALAWFHRAKAEPAHIALPLLDRAEAGFAAEPADETDNLAKVRYWRARKLIEQSDVDRAEVELGGAVELFAERRRPFDMAAIDVEYARIAAGRGDYSTARAKYNQAIAVYTELGMTRLADRIRTELDRLPPER